MIIAFIIIWLLLGLVVFFAAMRRGPRGAGGRSEAGKTRGESRAGGRLLVLGAVLLFAFGLVIPALVLAFNGAHKASVGSGGVHLSAEQQKGRYLFARGCSACHTLAGANAVGRIGPNLDVRVGENIAGTTPADHRAKAEALLLNAIYEGRARGNGQMPAQLYGGREAEEVASFVAAVAGH